MVDKHFDNAHISILPKPCPLCSIKLLHWEDIFDHFYKKHSKVPILTNHPCRCCQDHKFDSDRMLNFHYDLCEKKRALEEKMSQETKKNDAKTEKDGKIVENLKIDEKSIVSPRSKRSRIVSDKENTEALGPKKVTVKPLIAKDREVTKSFRQRSKSTPRKLLNQDVNKCSNDKYATASPSKSHEMNVTTDSNSSNKTPQKASPKIVLKRTPIKISEAIQTYEAKLIEDSATAPYTTEKSSSKERSGNFEIVQERSSPTKIVLSKSPIMNNSETMSFHCHLCSFKCLDEYPLVMHLIESHMNTCQKCNVKSVDRSYIDNHQCQIKTAKISRNIFKISSKKVSKDSSDSNTNDASLNSRKRSRSTADKVDQVPGESVALTENSSHPEKRDESSPLPPPPAAKKMKRASALASIKFLKSITSNNRKPLEIRYCAPISQETLDFEKRYLHKDLLKHIDDAKNCLECGFVGKIRDDTLKHIRNVHLKMKTYQCGACKFFSPTRTELKKHYLQIHDKNSEEIKAGNGVKEAEVAEIEKKSKKGPLSKSALEKKGRLSERIKLVKATENSIKTKEMPVTSTEITPLDKSVTKSIRVSKKIRKMDKQRCQKNGTETKKSPLEKTLTAIEKEPTRDASLQNQRFNNRERPSVTDIRKKTSLADDVTSGSPRKNDTRKKIQSDQSVSPRRKTRQNTVAFAEKADQTENAGKISEIDVNKSVAKAENNDRDPSIFSPDEKKALVNNVTETSGLKRKRGRPSIKKPQKDENLLSNDNAEKEALEATEEIIDHFTSKTDCKAVTSLAVNEFNDHVDETTEILQDETNKASKSAGDHNKVQKKVKRGKVTKTKHNKADYDLIWKSTEQGFLKLIPVIEKYFFCKVCNFKIEREDCYMLHQSMVHSEDKIELTFQMKKANQSENIHESNEIFVEKPNQSEQSGSLNDQALPDLSVGNGENWSKSAGNDDMQQSKKDRNENEVQNDPPREDIETEIDISDFDADEKSDIASEVIKEGSTEKETLGDVTNADNVPMITEDFPDVNDVQAFEVVDDNAFQTNEATNERMKTIAIENLLQDHRCVICR